jgi:hypothetical protein
MAVDLVLGESGRDWSRGSLPRGATGYVPRKWWTEAEAEAEVQKNMRGGGLFGTRMSRADAEEKTLADMKARKVAVYTSSGSILLPAKQQKAVFNKIDDVRYDLRRAGSHVRTGTLVLSAALGLLALASVFRTASGR